MYVVCAGTWTGAVAHRRRTLVEQLVDGDVEEPRERVERRHGRLGLAVLDLGDQGGRDIGLASELTQREAGADPHLFQPLAQIVHATLVSAETSPGTVLRTPAPDIDEISST